MLFCDTIDQISNYYVQARKTNTASLTSLHRLKQADRDLGLTLGNTRQKSCQDNA